MRTLPPLALMPLLLLLSFSAPANETAPSPIYYAIDPAFVVNIQDGSRPRFMQVKVQVMTYDNNIATQLGNHLPAVRHGLIMLLAHQSGDTMRSAVEREQVRSEAQTVLQQTLAEVSGLQSGVEAVYFTDLVIQ